ncbi:hypothetical protein, partial [Enterocloster bolteae]|uniref:hypothetical protein n=1 Tax=Enterocloster bolteae TaxID=208479 RepID=UPI002A831ABA
PGFWDGRWKANRYIWNFQRYPGTGKRYRRPVPGCFCFQAFIFFNTRYIIISENYFNKRCGGFKGICDKIEIIHNKMLKKLDIM